MANGTHDDGTKYIDSNIQVLTIRSDDICVQHLIDTFDTGRKALCGIEYNSMNGIYSLPMSSRQQKCKECMLFIVS